MSFQSPVKQGQESGTSPFSPNTSSTLRKPNPNQTFSTQAAESPEKQGSNLDQLISERNNYKQSFHKSEMELLTAQQEIKNLQDQVDYYKAKALASPSKSVYQRELDEGYRASSPLRASQQRTAREEALDQEVQRLRKQLIEKNSQVEEWMKRAARAETIANGEINLPEELKLKQQEIEKLNRELTVLQLKSQDVGKFEREIRDLQALLQFKEEENERLRNEKTSIQLENYKAKQSELNLRDSTIKLKSQLSNVEQQFEEAQKEKDTIIQIKDHLHQEKLKEVQSQADLEKSKLSKNLENVETLLNYKSDKLEQFADQNKQLDRKLLEKSVEAKRREEEAQLWRERAGSAEKEIVYVTEQKNLEKEKLREQLKREQSIERMVLQDKIQTLHNIVERKEKELGNTQLTLAETQQKKREVELAKIRLQSAVEDLDKKNQETEALYQAKLNVKDSQYQREINVLKSSHGFEKEQLNKNINSLTYVADKAMQEREQQRQTADEYRKQYLRSTEKKRQAEVESQYWQNKHKDLNRQKSIEIEAVDNLRKSQVENLKNSHGKILAEKEREAEAMKYLIGAKERNVRDLQLENSLTKSQVYQKDRELLQSKVEANLWQEKSLQEQRKREIDQQVSSELRREQQLQNDLNQSITRSVYQNEISSLNNVIDRKEQEADDWRNNYHRVLRSKY